MTGSHIHMTKSRLKFRRAGIQVTTDWVGLIDEWAYRFFAEMDYEAEAANAVQFKQEMARLDGIVVPDVFSDLTSHFVLTTAWVEGANLSSLMLLPAPAEEPSQQVLHNLRVHCLGDAAFP